MKVFRTACLAATAVCLSAAPAFAEDQSYSESGFDSVRSESGVTVNVTFGPSYSVQLVSGNADQASVSVSGDTLVLGRRGMSWGRGPATVFEVVMPGLDSAQATSGSTLDLDGIPNGDIRLSASAGSDLTASGSCGELQASASSGAEIQASDLSCSDVDASASSGGEVVVRANNRIEANASSGGNIRVSGNPSQKKISKSSGGNVRVSR